MSDCIDDLSDRVARMETVFEKIGEILCPTPEPPAPELSCAEGGTLRCECGDNVWFTWQRDDESRYQRFRCVACKRLVTIDVPIAYRAATGAAT